MKKLFTYVLALLISGISMQINAEPVVINIDEPGTAENLYEANSNATEIVLKGQINHYDLLWLAQYCKSLEKLDMSEVSIMELYDEISYEEYSANEMTTALSNSKNLKEITLPESIKSIAANAFKKCNLLESITIPSATIPKAQSYIIETTRMATVTLYVPENLVDEYKNSTAKAWKFDNILPIKNAEDNPYEGLEFDDFYGQCYYPLSESLEYDPIFYVFYMTNNSKKTVNNVEFEYWFDQDRSVVKTKSKDDIQLLPGQTLPDGLGFITFETPEDTKTHTITIRLVKVNGVEVDLGERVKIFRRYNVDNTYRKPTHFVELFADPTNAENYEGYKTVITSMAKMEQGTSQPNRYEYITYVSEKSDKFNSKDAAVNDLAQIYGVDGLPRMMLNRTLMTPYGMLQNDWALKNIKKYTPAVKIGSLNDVYEFMFQRSFYNPAFAEMNPSLEMTEDGKFIFNVDGRISVDQSTNDLYMNLYLVENTPLPELDEEDLYPAENAPVYQKFVKSISPFGGYELKINSDNTYSFSTEAIEIADYDENKYKLVASIYNYDDDIYKMAILQSCGIAVEKPKEVSIITATTVQSEGPMSFAVAAAEENTKVSIDWGDGIYEDYVVGIDFGEFQSELKGSNLRIKGNITKLNCIANKITEIDITKAPQLEVLQAEYNYLDKLDLSNSPNMKNLEIFGNMLKTIDLTKCNKLIRFVGTDNFLETVDISKCPDLEYFDCARTGRLESVDLSNCHKLKAVVLNKCSLTELDIPKDAPMELLLCRENKIEVLDLSTFDKLKEVDCSENNLSGIEIVSENLNILYASNNDIADIDLSKAKNLQHLKLTGNERLGSVDLSNNPKLETLGISTCNLETIDLSTQTLLKNLWCTENKLTEIDLTYNKKLNILKLGKNQLNKITFPVEADSLNIVSLPYNEFAELTIDKEMASITSLDLGFNSLCEFNTDNLPNLEILNLRANDIHAVSLKNNKKLNTFGFIENNMTAEELNNVYRELPELDKMPKEINLFNGTKSDIAAKTSNTNIAESKNWKPVVKGDGTGYDNIEECETSSLIITVDNGKINISSPFDNNVVRIYSAEGKLVGEYTFNGNSYSIDTNLNGIFVVRCIDKSTGKEITNKVIL